MNIFDNYLAKIKKLTIKLNKDGLIELPESLNGINVDIPPPNFDCDISSNISMVLSKVNNKSPLDLAKQLIDFIKNEDPNIENISVAKPRFINIKFKKIFWNNFVKEILINHKELVPKKMKEKKNI